MRIYGVLVLCCMLQQIDASEITKKLMSPNGTQEKQLLFYDNEALFRTNKSIKEIIPCYCRQDYWRPEIIVYNKTPVAAKIWFSRSMVYTTHNGTFASYAESTERIIQAGAMRKMRPYSPTLLPLGECFCNAQETPIKNITVGSFFLCALFNYKGHLKSTSLLIPAQSKMEILLEFKKRETPHKAAVQ